MELYSHSKYKGYSLFVEIYEPEDEDHYLYEGVAQLNGIDIFTSKSTVSGKGAEYLLRDQIDKSLVYIGDKENN